MHSPKTSRIPLDLFGLAGRGDIFRLSGGMTRDPAVERWMSDGPAELRSIARKWFERMRECGDDVRELLHDGHPIACIGDAPFAYVATFKDHVNVGFFRGAELGNADGLLEGTGKAMRHVKLRPDRAIDETVLHALIRRACIDMRRRLGA